MRLLSVKSDYGMLDDSIIIRHDDNYFLPESLYDKLKKYANDDVFVLEILNTNYRILDASVIFLNKEYEHLMMISNYIIEVSYLLIALRDNNELTWIQTNSIVSELNGNKDWHKIKLLTNDIHNRYHGIKVERDIFDINDIQNMILFAYLAILLTFIIDVIK